MILTGYRTEHTYIFAVSYAVLCTYVRMVQLNLNFTHACRHMRARLTCVKLQKLVCVRNFGVRTRASEHTRHMRNARHELALSLPHYTCGVTTGTVAVGNELQLFCS